MLRVLLLDVGSALWNVGTYLTYCLRRVNPEVDSSLSQWGDDIHLDREPETWPESSSCLHSWPGNTNQEVEKQLLWFKEPGLNPESALAFHLLAHSLLGSLL